MWLARVRRKGDRLRAASAGLVDFSIRLDAGKEGCGLVKQG